MLNEFFFEEENIANIWFPATLEVLRPVFEDHIITRRADVV